MYIESMFTKDILGMVLHDSVVGSHFIFMAVYTQFNLIKPKFSWSGQDLSFCVNLNEHDNHFFS